MIAMMIIVAEHFGQSNTYFKDLFFCSTDSTNECFRFTMSLMGALDCKHDTDTGGKVKIPGIPLNYLSYRDDDPKGLWPQVFFEVVFKFFHKGGSKMELEIVFLGWCVVRRKYFDYSSPYRGRGAALAIMMTDRSFGIIDMKYTEPCNYLNFSPKYGQCKLSKCVIPLHCTTKY
jgi:hypothetical protein